MKNCAVEIQLSVLQSSVIVFRLYNPNSPEFKTKLLETCLVYDPSLRPNGLLRLKPKSWNLTRPDPTQPNLTKPNPTVTNKTVRELIWPETDSCYINPILRSNLSVLFYKIYIVLTASITMFSI